MSLSSRRRFLTGSAAAAVLSAGAALSAMHAHGARAPKGRTTLVPSPYGPVSPRHDLGTGLALLQLPEGFEYCSYGWAGDPMDDGTPSPGRHDGMAVVQAQGEGRDRELVLVRNHEIGLASRLIRASALYDGDHGRLDGRCAGGGTVNLRFRGRQWVGMTPSLGGTLVNCSGGATPWGTWLSCEETGADRRGEGGRKHGYVFEVRPDARATTGRPIVAMGRFNHEAVAVDPVTRIVYLTEDNRNRAGLYRFVPDDRSGRPGSYEAGGRLQMARVVGRRNADLIVASAGDRHELEWVDIEDPDHERVELALPDFWGLTQVSGPFAQGWARGGLRLSRGEGVSFHGGKLLIVDTSTGVCWSGGRGHGEGAVWEYDPVTGIMEAIFVSTHAIAAKNPDNIAASPRGGVLLCGDGGGVDDDGTGPAERLVGLTACGESYVFARNNIVLGAGQIVGAGKRVDAGDYRRSELAGACFDPAGGVLFLNAYSPGITFAIWGPWERGPL